MIYDVLFSHTVETKEQKKYLIIEPITPSYYIGPTVELMPMILQTVWENIYNFFLF